MRVKRSVSLALAAVAAIALYEVPPSARADEVSALVMAGSLSDSPKGYMGCVTTSFFEKVYCFVAHEITEGPDTGMVRVAAKAWRPQDFLLPAVDEAVVGSDALQIGSAGGNPTIAFNVSLEDIGSVSINMNTQFPLANGGINDGCVLYPVHYELLSTTATTTLVWESRGVVAGETVVNWSTCDAYFIGPTSGLWRMASGV